MMKPSSVRVVVSSGTTGEECNGLLQLVQIMCMFCSGNARV